MKKNILAKSPGQTKKAALSFAKKILKSPSGKEAIMIGLEGDLGGGKTTFLQGFAKGLGVKEKILSPTFVVMKKFQVQGLRFNYFYHIDCYRIQKPKEILGLGFKEIISNPQNVVAIEWADRVRVLMSPKTVWIGFRFINRTTRKISIQSVLK